MTDAPVPKQSEGGVKALTESFEPLAAALHDVSASVLNATSTHASDTFHQQATAALAEYADKLYALVADVQAAIDAYDNSHNGTRTTPRPSPNVTVFFIPKLGLL